MTVNKPEPVFFSGQPEFRKWLMKNHNIATEVWVGFHKVHTGKPSLTWSQSVDVALCFGWIDGVRRTIDADRYQIRFTKRKSTSIWSAVNIKKVAELTRMGLMRPEGIAAFKKRKKDKADAYGHEKPVAELSAEYIKLFKSGKVAWKYFCSLPPSYSKLTTHWIMSAKQESTRLKRLQYIVSESAAGRNPWKDNKYRKK